MKKIIIYTDGAARGNPGPAGSGACITDADGNMLRGFTRPLGRATNNFAEYEAVILGLEGARKLFGSEAVKEMEVEVRMDSELVCKQLNGEYQIKEESLVPQFIKIWNMRVAGFPKIKFIHIPREKNKEADKLSNEAIDNHTAEKAVDSTQSLFG